MNIYFLKNMKTGRYFGDELEPSFEKAWFTDIADARDTAYVQNVLQHKNILSLDKWVVEVKVMGHPVMYVMYDDGCMKRVFDVYEVVKFYEDEPSAYEIGWLDGEEKHPLDLTKDWIWTDRYVRETLFDDHFWDSTDSRGFEEQPGKHFKPGKEWASAENTRKLRIEDRVIDFKYDGWGMFQRIMGNAIKNKSQIYDENGNALTAKVTSQFRYYDFGGSYTDIRVALLYPNGRLFGYFSID